MYKVDLTEKEARNIGEQRWLKANGKRYLFGIIGLMVALFVLALAIPDDAPRVISLGMLVVPIGWAAYLTLRCAKKAEKGGKEFAKSLKEGE